MNIKAYDVIALTAEIASTHTETEEAIKLRCGQVGTVLVDFDGEAFLVDFADNLGQTYAMETIFANKLVLLLHEPAITSPQYEEKHDDN